MPQFEDAPYTQLTSPARGDIQGVIKDVSEALPENQTKFAALEDLLKFGPWASKVRSVTASAAVTLADTDPIFIEIDPNGSDRDVNFPAKSDDNHGYFVRHSGGANTLTLKRSGGATITTLAAGEAKYIMPSTLNDFSALADSAAAAGGGIGDNLLTAPSFNVWQLGTSFNAATVPANNDDTYLADMWNLLSDGNDIVDVSRQSSSPPEGSRYFLRADVQTINKKFGFAQYLEANDAIPLRGKSVSLSIRAKSTAAAIENIRAGVLAWDGTADSITSDLVSAWGAEGANITPAANWTLENTPANLALTTSFQTFTIENISLDTAGLNNLAVFIWVDDTDAALNDILDIGWVKLEIGATATDFIPPDGSVDFDKCLKFLVKYGGVAFDQPPALGQRVGTNLVDVLIPLPTRMRITPVLVHSSPSYTTPPSGNQIGFYDNVPSAYVTATGAVSYSVAAATQFGALFRLTAATSFSGTSGDVGNIYLGADAWIAFDARL